MFVTNSDWEEHRACHKECGELNTDIEVVGNDRTNIKVDISCQVTDLKDEGEGLKKSECHIYNIHSSCTVCFSSTNIPSLF